eukprot:TRINITY_DN8537_c0_g1_i1.p1 TRINITY_DN8537_c0_g1~~TRINITY_DN8537_c0_g1_i1.p1  ORF type:complete len:377 (+),score=107.95 TRINITY_DN8537_c0_g1_i1:53-1183(+)
MKRSRMDMEEISGEPANMAKRPRKIFKLKKNANPTSGLVSKPPATNPFASFKIKKAESKPSSSFLSFKKELEEEDSVEDKKHSKASRITALNDCFFNFITKQHSTNPSSSWEAGIRDYLKHLEGINKENSSASTASSSTAPKAATQVTPSFAKLPKSLNDPFKKQTEKKDNGTNFFGKRSSETESKPFFGKANEAEPPSKKSPFSFNLKSNSNPTPNPKPVSPKKIETPASPTTTIDDDETKTTEFGQVKIPGDKEGGAADETCYFKHKAKLLKHDKESNTFKAAGVGKVKLFTSDDNKSRIVFWTETGDIRLNALMYKGMKFNRFKKSSNKFMAIENGEMTLCLVAILPEAEGENCTAMADSVNKMMLGMVEKMG